MPRKIVHVSTVDLTLRFLILRQLTALRDAGFDVSAISAPGPWVKELEAEGIRHIAWGHATRAWNPRSDAAAFGELVSIFRREHFDLVHTHNPKPGVLGRAAARLAGVPHVVNTVHGLYATPQDRLRKRVPVLAAEWLAARLSDVELYQSSEDLEWARRLHVVRPHRSIHLGNGIDLSRFTPALRGHGRVRGLRADLGIGDDELVVGIVGRMVREKGYAEFFEAARRVRARVPSARFLAVGDRDPDKADSITAEQLDRAAEDVIFTGWREDVPDLMAAMDVFVLPSWREGLPRSAIEAAGIGLPSVLTDIRGCREVARDGVEASFVPVRDPRGLADAIERLLLDPALRQGMGAAARARAEERFDERRVVATVVGVSRKLLGVPDETEPADGGVRLRPARAADADAMARLHRESMPTAFLPTLGQGFLRRLYRSLSADADAFVFVAERRGRVVGFASAVMSVNAFYRRFIRKDGLAAGFAAVPRLVRPSVARRVVETARYPSMANGLPDAELLSIAVDASSRERGVGSDLVGALVTALERRGVGEFKVIVGTDNERANRFYERLSFRPAGSTAVHRGVSSNVWVMACPS